MSGPGELTPEDGKLPPAGRDEETEPTPPKPRVVDGSEAGGGAPGEEEGDEEEAVASAHLEPSTLPWSGDRGRIPDSGRASSEQEEEIYRGGPDPPHAQGEDGGDGKGRWRESMPEGDRWRDDVTEVQRDGSLADDEEEEEEEEKEEESMWTPQKAPLGFTPTVNIVRPSYKEPPEESRLMVKREEEEEEEVLVMKPDAATQFYQDWTAEDPRSSPCQLLCGDRVRVVLALLASGVLFPLLVWGGYALLPFDPPLVRGAPLRVVYTLRCSFFASVPVLLGVLALGGARLRHGDLAPLHQAKMVDREVAVHWHYVNESLALFLLYFLQLAVMATYISHDLVKLVPLLTIVFVFGRLIYWLCLALGSSSIRALGFGLSFLPVLVMLAANLYYVCSAVGQEAVFQVAPPTTAPPPRQRWWG